MSPFSALLHTLRMGRNVRQSDLAAAMGYDQSYISALENGQKGPPPEAFVQKLADTLQLTPAEREELKWSIRASERKLLIDTDAPLDLFLLLDELREKLPRLGPSAVQTLRSVLKMADTVHDEFNEPLRRLKRRSREEAAMQ